MQKETTCFFTGHRRIPEQMHSTLHERLCDCIRDLYEKGYRDFIAGGAIGFDTIAANTVIKLRETELSDLRLHIYAPCPAQDKYFSEEQKAEYAKVLGLADSVKTVSEFYHNGCMHKRNRAMAQDSSICIAFCTRETGGTAYTVNFAKKQGIDIIYI
jgi:uncharacterized phage-like protein YoqJ